jgi:site-specific DNA-methyltransferase (cytosine-N4-specific)
MATLRGDMTISLPCQPAYTTELGSAYCIDSLYGLENLPDSSINLVITSPPFALQRQKDYGNKAQDEYLDWIIQFGKLVFKKLKNDGSFVIDLGGAYQKGKPVRSLYNFRLLIRFCDELGFRLAEDFYWYNPSKLPSPIEWVNKRKIRVKDAVNTIWWLSKDDSPKSNITNVLVEYSDRMKKLISDPEKFYTPAKRPSGHDIGSSFGRDNGGAIPPNLLQISNSESGGSYLKLCKDIGIKGHPARFPAKLPEFFIKMLTDPGDMVLDIFSGSNTTGFVAECEKRKWISFEQELPYVASSIFRFVDTQDLKHIKALYNKIINMESITLGSADKFLTSKANKIAHDVKINARPTLFDYVK